MFQNRITHHRWVRTSTLFFVALAFACVAQIAAAQSALGSHLLHISERQRWQQWNIDGECLEDV